MVDYLVGIGVVVGVKLYWADLLLRHHKQKRRECSGDVEWSENFRTWQLF